MPTTQPLDPGDDAEGQLKPIAEFQLTAPASPQVATVVAPPPQAVHSETPIPPAQGAKDAAHSIAPSPETPIATPRVPTSSISSPHNATAMPRTSLRMPSISLRNSTTNIGINGTTVITDKRQTPFSDAAFMQAWQAFIDNHPSDHVLIAAMRAKPIAIDSNNPTPTEEHSSRTYEVIVDNNVQVDEFNKRMDEIMASISAFLSNDYINLKVRVNDGPASPYTWNESQVLESMKTTHPNFAEFMEILSLTQF